MFSRKRAVAVNVLGRPISVLMNHPDSETKNRFFIEIAHSGPVTYRTAVPSDNEADSLTSVL